MSDNTKSADPLPHDWYEITEDDRSVFCNRCDICKCHGGELVDLPCPGEPTGPEFGFTEGNDDALPNL